MATRAYGHLFIQATTPQEDPVMVGSLWSDTATGLLKVCTAVAPYTFVQASADLPIDLTSEVTGDLPFANLAQGSALSVLGVTGNATADHASIAAGADHQVFRRSGTSVGFGAVNLAQSAAITGILPPGNNWTVTTSTTTGATNNWAPTLSGHTTIEWNGASGAQFTGLDGGVTGQVVVIKNVTASQVATFAHASGSSDADNRFTNLATSAPTPIAAGGWVIYQHDGTNWKLIGHEQGAWISRAFSAGNFTGSASMTWTVDSGDVIADRYRLVGKTLQYELRIQDSDVGGTPNNTLLAAIPGGFTSAGSAVGAGFMNDAGAGFNFAGGIVSASGTTISIFKNNTSAWTSTSSDNTAVYLSIGFEVN